MRVTGEGFSGCRVMGCDVMGVYIYLVGIARCFGGICGNLGGHRTDSGWGRFGTLKCLKQVAWV